jgi:hypothetical protein
MEASEAAATVWTASIRQQALGLEETAEGGLNRCLV